jgi:hypothetical protein
VLSVQDLLRKANWLLSAREEWEPPVGFFMRPCDTIARELLDLSDDKTQAIGRLDDYINITRAALDDDDLNRLERARKIINDK